MNIPVRKILTITLSLLASVSTALAQGTTEKRDSVIYRQSAAMDSTLVGKNIFNLLSGYGGGDSKVTVHQSQRILNAFESHVAANSSRTSTGFRVRIFNDNKQTSRNDSEAALERFKGMFPGFGLSDIFQSFLQGDSRGFPHQVRSHAASSAGQRGFPDRFHSKGDNRLSCG